ncbi:MULTISPECIES: ANTAR domain-containing protein [unclassified Rhodococcus (in: high G+C Gram-positive bacteria)]|nr:MULTISPECIES: ANTAR domain-containing protein [unclassified Rhodococcus (in: high G+C Gram-positive bacteria)]
MEQAEGMLMVRHGVSGNRAFGVLVEQAEQRNIRVTVLAAGVVDTLTTG